jgi:hypothetical protein
MPKHYIDSELEQLANPELADKIGRYYEASRLTVSDSFGRFYTDEAIGSLNQEPEEGFDNAIEILHEMMDLCEKETPEWLKIADIVEIFIARARSENNFPEFWVWDGMRDPFTVYAYLETYIGGNS